MRLKGGVKCLRKTDIRMILEMQFLEQSIRGAFYVSIDLPSCNDLFVVVTSLLGRIFIPPAFLGSNSSGNGGNINIVIVR